MKKWILTAAVLLALIAVWVTKFLWLAPVSPYLGQDQKALGNLANLATALIGVATLLAPVIDLWRHKYEGRKAAPSGQTVQNVTAGRDVIQAGHNVQTGGTKVGAGSIGTLQGDNVAGDKVTRPGNTRNISVRA